MEILNSYTFRVTNIKVSVKLQRAVHLDFVEERCKKISCFNVVYCSRKRNKNILTIRYNGFTFILFKSSTEDVEGAEVQQHCNITKLKSCHEAEQAIRDLQYLIDQPPAFLNYKIDNYSCCADIHKTINLEAFFLSQLDISCYYNLENFPALIVYCPNHLTSSPRQCCHIYSSGRFVFVGCNNLPEVTEFFLWVVERISPYAT